ncbi:hypothetical protein RBG61_09725 [Paludicola sp. MB14-C6]|uniref:hypothetical protein n=1 Tax=Paludihabitans sp. MB14-C6 TaxID=3070656 RepID=UPI0027DD8801|nr:hypothetical protein [Paludicola sp. MB14-C6]WMJ22266.1 hypothetical protein RBG61_09725 [Paludicola sp. MB14-C6]
MILYHGSNIANIKTLEPKLADHDRLYIYLTTKQIISAFYTVNAVERPYYWFPYGFDKDGNIQYHELYPNALKEVSQGRKGYIYTVDVDEDKVMPFKNIPTARLGTTQMKPIDCLVIEDCYNWLMKQEEKGIFQLCRYENKSKQELENWFQGLLAYITEKNMIETPNCSYAKFVQTKFPQVWANYEKKRLK